MEETMTRRDPASRLIIPLIALLPLVSLGQTPGDTPSEAEPSAFNCGTLGLYALLRLEGRPAELAEIEAHLPPPTPGGYSMKELRDASRACGLKLSGVLLKKEERALDRPMLAFVKRGQHGHFLAIRPVGHTGKMVQVIDSVRPPEVLDKVDLFASRDWTGLALIPSRANWPLRIACTLALISASTSLLLWAAPRRRRAVQPAA
jgi:hypothetical protein